MNGSSAQTTRSSAQLVLKKYLELVNSLQIAESVFFRYENPAAGPLVGKGVGDANAATADKALDALHAYLQKCNEAQAAK